MEFNKTNINGAKPEYVLETLGSNSNSSLDSSQAIFDPNSESDEFYISNENNLTNCGLANRDGYTVLRPVFSTPLTSTATLPSMRQSGFSLNTSAIIPTGNDYTSKSCCLECGGYARLRKCTPHCNLDLCENCRQKHWQIEVDELLKMKTHLENNVADLRNYLGYIFLLTFIMIRN